MSGEWYDVSTDGTLLNSVLYPGDDNSWWNRPAGSVISDALNTAKDAISLENDDSTLSQSEYDFTYKVFPNDLGMDYHGHYMVININVPVWPGTDNARGSQTIQNQFDVLKGEYSKVDVLRFGNSKVGDATRRGTFQIPRRTRRIAQSIALYMPGAQLVYGTRNNYQEIAMAPIAGKVAAGAATFGVGLITGLASKSAGAAINAGQATGQVLDGLGAVVTQGSIMAGAPINPCIEVMFTHTLLRDFTFDFLMVPRNATEAKTIKEIIRTLRFHAAPEIDRGGFTLIPPAEFDITFFHRGVENTAIPRINTCVLVGMEVDYTSGLDGTWQTFLDGNPMATVMRLQFQEVEMVHKLRILQNF